MDSGKTIGRLAALGCCAGLLLGAAGCGIEPVTTYGQPNLRFTGRESFLVLPFMDSRTFIDAKDPYREGLGEYIQALFAEQLRERAPGVDARFPEGYVRPPGSLTVDQVAALGRQYGGDYVISGQIFNFNEGRMGSGITARAGMFLRIVSSADGRLVFVGDHYVFGGSGMSFGEGARDRQARKAADALIDSFLPAAGGARAIPAAPAAAPSAEPAPATAVAPALTPRQAARRGRRDRNAAGENDGIPTIQATPAPAPAADGEEPAPIPADKNGENAEVPNTVSMNATASRWAWASLAAPADPVGADEPPAAEDDGDGTPPAPLPPPPDEAPASDRDETPPADSAPLPSTENEPAAEPTAEPAAEPTSEPVAAPARPSVSKNRTDEVNIDPKAADLSARPGAAHLPAAVRPGAVRVLLLPYYDAPNPDNLIVHTGGGEVVTALMAAALSRSHEIELLLPPPGRVTHDRAVGMDEAVALAREVGAQFVIAGEVDEFRRAQSTPSWLSAVVSSYIIAAQVIFAEMSGVEMTTRLYDATRSVLCRERYDVSRQKYVVQAEKTVRRLAAAAAPSLLAAIRNGCDDVAQPRQESYP